MPKIARYEGYCVQCGNRIAPGNKIESSPRGGWRHVGCADVGDYAEGEPDDECPDGYDLAVDWYK